MYLAQPQDFLQLLGALLLFIAVVLALFSLAPWLRSFSLRLAAINFLAALALFSNYWITYFAAIFIIATAVTELEFLHILAAIIRGDKNYFDFRREFLTRDEASQKARQDEVLESHAPEDDDKSSAKSALATSRGSINRIAINAFGVEERALDWFEKEYSMPVQRYVRFWNNEYIVEVDGVVQGKRGEPDTVIEVKWIRKEPPGTGAYGRVVDQVSELGRKYREITKRDVDLILLLVVPEHLPNAMVTQLTKRLYDRGVKNKVVFVTYDQLKPSGAGNDKASNPD
jgi:hypothetical protein